MFNLKTAYGEYKDCSLYIDHYNADNSLYIGIYNEEGSICDLTKCLTDPSLKPNEAYVDTSNAPFALSLIADNAWGKPTGKETGSGWCRYPVVAFDMDELSKHIGEMEE